MSTLLHDLDMALRDLRMMTGSQDKTLIEWLFEVVAPIVGGVIVGVALHKSTTLPFWACILIAMPIGTILAWAALFGMFYMLELIARVIGGKKSAHAPLTIGPDHYLSQYDRLVRSLQALGFQLRSYSQSPKAFGNFDATFSNGRIRFRFVRDRSQLSVKGDRDELEPFGLWRSFEDPDEFEEKLLAWLRDR